MTKQPQVTTATKSFTVRVYESTKTRLKKVVRKKAEAEDRDVTELELVEKYINRGLSMEERKLSECSK